MVTRRRHGQNLASKRVTIHEVAAAAGVSITTVSNVLNGRAESMTEETRSRVQEVIRTLRYRPSGVARNLVQRRTATIGLVLAEIETPLFLKGLGLIEPRARHEGYNVLVCHASSADDERAAVDLFLEKEAEAIIFLSASESWNEDHLTMLKTASIPTVLVNRVTRHPEFDQINWDNGVGVTAAVHHLAALGHTRIAHLLGPERREGTRQRLAGFRRGLDECRLVLDERYLRRADYTAALDGWSQSTRELLALGDPPSAIIASDDTVAAVCMQTIQSMGLDVPGDVAVVGIDDQDFCQYLYPPLTTIRLPIAEAGECAIQLVLDRLNGVRSESRHIMLDTPLIVRQSTQGLA
jgi:LacI family transcriptional regulator